VIAQLHQRVLSGDYARVLYKLSEASKGKGGASREYERMRTEARSLLSARSHLATYELADDEKAYDEMVYILWR
jgi:hypothetical protein